MNAGSQGLLVSINVAHCFIIFFCRTLQVVVKASNVYPKDSEAPSCGVDDMTKLAYLHEPGVLDNLRLRYDINEIYVSTSMSLWFPCSLFFFGLFSLVLRNFRLFYGTLILR